MPDISALMQQRGRVLSAGLARVAWGNDAWAVNNRGQARLLRKLRADAPGVAPTADPGAAAASASIDALGYALLGQAYDAGLAAGIHAGYAAVIDDPARTLDMGGRIPGLVRYVRDPLVHVPALRRLLTPHVRAVLDVHFGGRWKAGSVRMWRIAHIPAEERGHHHYGNLWHCDQHPTSTLKLFVQIDPGAGGDSAFRFHDVPSTRRIMRSGYLGMRHVVGPAAQALEHPGRVIRFDGPPGTAAFCNTTRCLHRAGIPDAGTTRGMVQVVFAPSDGPAAADPFDGLAPDPGVQPGRIA